ncbi:Glycogen accumulation regulator GarA [Pelotomaculum sp. FP]|uniref:FhaA domain-containing protein n=1 Tax=Pelotomaculum sp. FP TaxID=261474 RepID=UPI0010652299|nr:DUF3662 and FHA domain-containing protein [Pelotomaculum sp. FP]TEB17907.1 Glycogen accumulation regulator GarA [Pelotomaculum sp. FP]
MGVFSGLEGSLEKYIDSFFKDNFGGRVQPVDIAKKLAREMRDARRVSIRNIYVPNLYTVFLHPADCENIATFSSLLAKELGDYVTKKAAEKKYTLTGPPSVKFEQDQALPAGGLRIAGEFSESPPEKEHTAPDEKPIEHTQRFRPVKEYSRGEAVSPACGSLRVNDGPDRGKVFQLKAASIVLGRHESCDIVLNDSSVSRRHARLELHRGRYTIVDLGSTNGTMVNGVRIGTKVLEPGDTVILGTTTCSFKVE